MRLDLCASVPTGEARRRKRRREDPRPRLSRTAKPNPHSDFAIESSEESGVRPANARGVFSLPRHACMASRFQAQGMCCGRVGVSQFEPLLAGSIRHTVIIMGAARAVRRPAREAGRVARAGRRAVTRLMGERKAEEGARQPARSATRSIPRGSQILRIRRQKSTRLRRASTFVNPSANKRRGKMER